MDEFRGLGDVGDAPGRLGVGEEAANHDRLCFGDEGMARGIDGGVSEGLGADCGCGGVGGTTVTSGEKNETVASTKLVVDAEASAVDFGVPAPWSWVIFAAFSFPLARPSEPNQDERPTDDSGVASGSDDGKTMAIASLL